MNSTATDTTRTFATRLRKLRKSSGLDQAQLGEKLGVTRGSISFYENGDRVPNIEVLAAAADYFEVSADWLLGLGEKAAPQFVDHCANEEICPFYKEGDKGWSST